MVALSLADGERLVKAARQAIEIRLVSPHFKKEMVEKYIDKFNGDNGVFVTISHYPTGELRGFMGTPGGTGTLKESLVDAAIAAATEDPGFVPLSHMEFEHIIITVSVLSRLERIRVKGDARIKREIIIGKDGLIVQSGYRSALLLPSAPLENGWTKEEFLENLCMKAGLENHAWRHSNVILQKFRSQVFRETSPGGLVEEATYTTG